MVNLKKKNFSFLLIFLVIFLIIIFFSIFFYNLYNKEQYIEIIEINSTLINDTKNQSINSSINLEEEENENLLVETLNSSQEEVIYDIDKVGFISKWDTRKASSSENNQIKLPLVLSGEYDFYVFFEDIDKEPIYINNFSDNIIEFSTPGIYTIRIEGKITGWSFNKSGDVEKIIEISNWGPLNIGNYGFAFAGAKNLIITAQDELNLSDVKTLKSLFDMPFDNKFEIRGNINNWDMSEIRDISGMFAGAKYFNSNIGDWDVSNIENMSNVFLEARKFNQPLNTWDVSNVKNMRGMFTTAVSFNQPLNNWNVSNVENMRSMFLGAEKFNQPLNTWDVANVKNMRNMFYSAISFNQPLNNWNVSNVENMYGMFFLAENFNQPLNSWNIVNVRNFDYMFYLAENFNQDLSNWCSKKIEIIPNNFIDSNFFNLEFYPDSFIC